MNKIILLTGCSRGLGLSLTRILLASGNIVYGISRTSNSDISKLKDDFPYNFYHLKYDLADTSNIKEEVFKKFITSKVRLDAFVNNAAIAYDDIVTNLQIEPLENMFRINVYSPLLMTKYAIRNMLLHKTKGSIIHVSSISVHTAYKGLSMYASSKGALEAFSKGTAREWGERGIRSNCLVAGFMETEMSGTLNEDQKNRIYNRTALKSPTDILSVAKTILFLLTDDASSITGQNIHVDSGTI